MDLIEKPICKYTWLPADQSFEYGSQTYSSAKKPTFEKIDLEQKEAVSICTGVLMDYLSCQITDTQSLQTIYFDS